MVPMLQIGQGVVLEEMIAVISTTFCPPEPQRVDYRFEAPQKIILVQGVGAGPHDSYTPPARGS